MGWKPQEEFDGGDEYFVDAAEYIRKGKDIQDSMRRALKDQKKQLSTMNMNQTLAELKAHNEKVYKAEISNLKKSLADLKSQKKEAIEEGDVERVEGIDEQIEALKESIEAPVVKPAVTGTSEADAAEFDAWVKENRWYETNPEMRAYADQIADDNPSLSFARVSALAATKVREVFPDQFSQKRTSQSRVEGAGRKSSGSKVRFSESSLTHEQREIMRQFVQQGIMTKKQYLDDMSKMAQGGI